LRPVIVTNWPAAAGLIQTLEPFRLKIGREAQITLGGCREVASRSMPNRQPWPSRDGKALSFWFVLPPSALRPPPYTSIMLSTDFLSLLCCPDDRTPLKQADDELVARLNASIAAGKLKNRGAQTMSKQLDGALVRADGRIAYPIIDEIPVLLIDEGLPLDNI